MKKTTLEQRRKKLGLSQTEFGNKLQVTQTTVSLWETGKQIPKLDKIRKMANMFGIKYMTLLAEIYLQNKE